MLLVKRATAAYRPPSEHYENFPVASWLCPPHLRAPIAAIYWFARTADDLADEGDASLGRRLADLAAVPGRPALRLTRAWHTPVDGPRYSIPWAPWSTQFRLPVALLADLLAAFEQDVAYTCQQRRYQSDSELLDYCSRSANPVGRLLLHLYGVDDARLWRAATRSAQPCN